MPYTTFVDINEGVSAVLPGYDQSMAAAQPSNGVATAWPIPGTIFTVAATARHGNASRPHPPSWDSAAATNTHSTARDTLRGTSFITVEPKTVHQAGKYLPAR
ncbi:hypothetical protein WM40_04475 [Robbsia andropogonis]|uniref:Uncharacterized protein n=1 Tax=Robbsia andropogonis TaxID=28092 RepID=A0A0F5K479_9BURK|nr:hypothetical protein WM40_04475 [Robbsia andropogonis]